MLPRTSSPNRKNREFIMHNIEGIHAPSHLHTSAQITKLSNNLMHKPTLFTIS